MQKLLLSSLIIILLFAGIMQNTLKADQLSVIETIVYMVDGELVIITTESGDDGAVLVDDDKE